MIIRKLFSVVSFSLLLSQPSTYSMENASPEACQEMCKVVGIGMAVVAIATTSYAINYFKNKSRIKIETQKKIDTNIKKATDDAYILNPTNIVKQGPAYLKQLAQELPAELSCYITIPTDTEDYKDVLENASRNINLLLFRNTPKNRSKLKGKNVYIFYGPSGVGKTTTAMAIAYMLNRPILLLKGSNIANTYQNSGAQNITNLLSPLLDSPHDWVIIIDEIDSLVRGSNVKENSNVQESNTATAFWLALDDLSKNKNILVIGTCNNPDLLPSALKQRAQRKFIAFRELSPENKVKLFFKYLIKDAPCPININCHEDAFKLVIQEKLAPHANRIIKEMTMDFPGYILFEKHNEITQEAILAFFTQSESDMIPDNKIESENERLHKESMTLNREALEQTKKIHEDNKALQLRLHQENQRAQDKHSSDALKQAKDLHDESLQQQTHNTLLSIDLQKSAHSESIASQKAMHRESMVHQQKMHAESIKRSGGLSYDIESFEAGFGSN